MPHAYNYAGFKLEHNNASNRAVVPTARCNPQA